MWEAWGIRYRDVAIVDDQNELINTFNLTDFGLADSTNYANLKNLLVDAAVQPPESDWQCPVEPLDVDNNGFIAPLDALLVINDLDTYPGGALPAERAHAAPYVDTSGDGIVAPLDALAVINHLTFVSGLNASGDEGDPAAALSTTATVSMDQPVDVAILTPPTVDSTPSQIVYDVIDRVFAEADDEAEREAEREAVRSS